MSELMKPLRLPRSATVPLIIIAVLFVMLLSIGWSTYLEFSRQRASPTDSAQWSIFQTSLEFNRLNTAYGQFRVEPNVQNRDELKKRADIFFSRVSILKSSDAFDAFRSNSYFAQTTQILSAFAEKLSDLIAREDFTRLKDDPEIAFEFKEMGRSVTTFVASTVQTQANWDTAARDRLQWLLLSQLATSGLAIIAFLYFAFVVIQQRNHALAREDEIRARGNLLRATVNSSLDGVLIANAKGEILEVNEAAATMFGYTRARMEGHDMSKLIVPPRLREAHSHGMARHVATGKARVIGRRIEIEALRHDGTEFPVELSIATTGSGSKATYIAFMRDISDRRVSELSLQYAKERAEFANREKTEFLASISHEMRTPLTGILGALDLLSETDLSKTQFGYVQTANRSGHALLSVISDVLDISRLEAGKVELDLAPLDVTQIVGDVLEIIGKLAADRGNVIHVDLDKTISPQLVGDAARIRQVLLNLAINATKFTYNGTVTISVTTLAIEDQHADMKFAVRDTGPGISESDKGKLFRNFSQLRNDAQHQLAGSGLGLAISNRLVGLMSGTIGVDSEIGKGSTFWFRLTLPIIAEPAVPVGGTQAHHAQSLPVTPKSVLVIDDNETIRSIIAGQLVSRGHSAETADGALKGLEMLAASEFDAVILDISMPGMDGFEALQAIRKLPGAAGRTPVIALTAHAMIEDRERCLKAGFDQFLTKPVRSNELAQAIALATSGGAAMAHSAPDRDGNEDTSDLFDLDELREQFVSVAPMELHRIVDRFGIELDQQAALLKKEGHDISLHHFRRIVHLLSGSSSMIGATRLAALAGKLDTQASQPDDVTALAHLDELTLLIEQTRRAVEAAKSTLKADETRGA